MVLGSMHTNYKDSSDLIEKIQPFTGIQSNEGHSQTFYKPTPPMSIFDKDHSFFKRYQLFSKNNVSYWEAKKDECESSSIQMKWQKINYQSNIDARYTKQEFDTLYGASEVIFMPENCCRTNFVSHYARAINNFKSAHPELEKKQKFWLLYIGLCHPSSFTFYCILSNISKSIKSVKGENIPSLFMKYQGRFGIEPGSTGGKFPRYTDPQFKWSRNLLDAHVDQLMIVSENLERGFYYDQKRNQINRERYDKDIIKNKHLPGLGSVTHLSFASLIVLTGEARSVQAVRSAMCSNPQEHNLEEFSELLLANNVVKDSITSKQLGKWWGVAEELLDRTTKSDIENCHCARIRKSSRLEIYVKNENMYSFDTDNWYPIVRRFGKSSKWEKMQFKLVNDCYSLFLG